MEEPARPSEQAVSRVGQVWEVDLNDTGFAEDAKDSITYAVLADDPTPTGAGLSTAGSASCSRTHRSSRQAS